MTPQETITKDINLFQDLVSGKSKVHHGMVKGNTKLKLEFYHCKDQLN